MGKSISSGFGVVRMLTPASQQEVFKLLDEADIDHTALRRRPPLHLTLVGFVRMSRQEQKAFNAGFNVKRLEERFENSISETAPRKPLVVELGAVGVEGNSLYCEIDNPNVYEEQLQLVGQVAMHGISMRRINHKVVPPHVSIGIGQQAPIEALREQMETVLSGQHATLQRWGVYPERYA